jgi:hypothetical protein
MNTPTIIARQTTEPLEPLEGRDAAADVADATRTHRCGRPHRPRPKPAPCGKASYDPDQVIISTRPVWPTRVRT